MHAQMDRERNEKWNTTHTSDVTKRTKLDELWPEDANTNTNMYPKYTKKQEIDEMPPQSNTDTKRDRGEKSVKLGSSLAGGGYGTADSARDPIPPEESLNDENRNEEITTIEEPQEEIQTPEIEHDPPTPQSTHPLDSRTQTQMPQALLDEAQPHQHTTQNELERNITWTLDRVHQNQVQ